MSCCYELGRDHSEDLPEEEVQEEDGTEESLSGQVKSDKEDTDGQKELVENEETKFKKQFPNLTPDSVEKLFSLTSIPCHQGKFVWDCELCLEMLLLELKLSFDLDT